MISNHIARNVGDKVQERIDALGIGQKMQDLPEHLWHDSFRYYVKEDKTRKGGPNMRMIRLDPSEASLTVTGYIFNKFVHPTENRYVTVREAARLQGFPDNLEFYGTLTSTQQQVGNAVPIQLAQAVFNKVCEFAALNGFNRKLSAMSLFSGAGGMDIGATLANHRECSIDINLAVEIWRDACESMKSYFGEHHPILNEDIKNITSPSDTWKKYTNSVVKPDIVFGGPPCQAFSQAGKQKSVKDARGELIFTFKDFIKDLQPNFFVMENVSNLKGVDKGSIYNDLKQQFKDIGYNLTDEVLTATDYGAPQKRKRIFFIGCKAELGKVEVPQPTHGNSLLGDLKPFNDVGNAFYGLPKAEFNNARRKEPKCA